MQSFTGELFMKRLLASLALLLCGASLAAHAAEVRVLSAGAVEPGLQAFAKQARDELGSDLRIEFNTAPQIAKRLADGEVFDILISPPAVIDKALADGKVVAAGRLTIGRVGAGIAVRSAAPAPDVATVETLKQALLAADSVVYNSASTGLYLDRLFASLGLAGQLQGKTTRYPNGAAVMEHLINGRGAEIGFGAITEIKLYTDKGLKFVGPLPAEVQNYTSYDAALMAGAGAPAATAVLRQLAMPAAKAAFSAAGVE
jgi:molybdate transport system substrate-binding protein